MLRERQSEGREDGFTLIELLVVVIIIGILAAIAIPVFLNQRERAWTSAVESDTRNAAVALEAYYSDTGHYDVSDADLSAVGMTLSENVTLEIYTADPHQEYCIQGTHERLEDDPVRIYSSVQGGFVETECTGTGTEFAWDDNGNGDG